MNGRLSTIRIDARDSRSSCKSEMVLKATHCRWLAQVVAFAATASLLGGCKSGGRNMNSQSGTALAAAKRNKPHVDNTANARGITFHWSEKAGEEIRRVLDVQAENGRLSTAAESGELNRARGVIYRENKPRARFTAPVVNAYKERSIVIARGGVIMVSIEPPGMTLKAQQVTWDATHQKVYAEGDARFFYKPPGASRPVSTGRAEHITLDTELQSFTIP